MKTVLQVVSESDHNAILKRLTASRHVRQLNTFKEENQMRYTFKITHRAVLSWKNLFSCFRESGILRASIVNDNAVIITKL